VAFLKDNFGVTELDIEFYFDLKKKIIKSLQNSKNYAKMSKKEQETSVYEAQVTENPQKDSSQDPHQFKSGKELQNFGKKKSLPVLKLQMQKTDTEVTVHNGQKANLSIDKLPTIDRRVGQESARLQASKKIDHEAPIPQIKVPNQTQSSQFISYPSAPRVLRKTSIHKDKMPQKISNSRSNTEMTAMTSFPIQEIADNKYYRRKPFSWNSQGDSFTMISPEKVYITNPELSTQISPTHRTKNTSNDTVNKTITSTMYSPKWEQTGYRSVHDASFLQVREPYLLESPADFYRKVIPPRLPPPPPKAQAITVRRRTNMTTEKSEISKYILVPADENQLNHKPTSREWIAADFTKHQLSMYQPLVTSSSKRTELNPPKDHELLGVNDSEENADNGFRSIIVKKFVFDNSKAELEAIKKLVLFYEQRDNTLLAQSTKTENNKADETTSLGYTKQQFDNENQMINLFLATLNDSTNPDVTQIITLKRIIEKRLELVNHILANLDYENQIKEHIMKKEDKYLKFLNNQINENSLAMVGKNISPTKSHLRAYLKQKRRLMKRKDKKDENQDKSKDSNMEEESSSEEFLEREVHYQKVLSRKVNIDKQKFLSLCIEFIRKELKRVKHALKMNEVRRKYLPNPNRNCRTAMGFSENLMALLKKNKEFLPQDIKMDLMRILPEGDLKELGSDMFIDDELATLAITKELDEEKRRLEELRKARRKKEEIVLDQNPVDHKETMSKFNIMAEELNNDLTKILGEKEETAPEVPGDQNPPQNNLRKLSDLDASRLTDDQKSKLKSRGVIFRQGRVMMKDTAGNVVDIETVITHNNDKLRASPKSPGSQNPGLDVPPPQVRLETAAKSIGIQI
jgi:hypothetical protein